MDGAHASTQAPGGYPRWRPKPTVEVAGARPISSPDAPFFNLALQHDGGIDTSRLVGFLPGVEATTELTTIDNGLAAEFKTRRAIGASPVDILAWKGHDNVRIILVVLKDRLPRTRRCHPHESTTTARFVLSVRSLLHDGYYFCDWPDH
jgi:hypothetical protein